MPEVRLIDANVEAKNFCQNCGAQWTETLTMDELKPCPFCDGENIIYTDTAEGRKNTHCIYCADCGCGTANFSGCSSHETLKNCVVKAWNRRATIDAKELIENIQILSDYGNSDGQSEYERGFAAACEIIIDIIMTMNE